MEKKKPSAKGSSISKKGKAVPPLFPGGRDLSPEQLREREAAAAERVKVKGIGKSSLHRQELVSKPDSTLPEAEGSSQLLSEVSSAGSSAQAPNASSVSSTMSGSGQSELEQTLRNEIKALNEKIDELQTQKKTAEEEKSLLADRLTVIYRNLPQEYMSRIKKEIEDFKKAVDRFRKWKESGAIQRTVDIFENIIFGDLMQRLQKKNASPKEIEEARYKQLEAEAVKGEKGAIARAVEIFQTKWDRWLQTEVKDRDPMEELAQINVVLNEDKGISYPYHQSYIILKGYLCSAREAKDKAKAQLRAKDEAEREQARAKGLEVNLPKPDSELEKEAEKFVDGDLIIDIKRAIDAIRIAPECIVYHTITRKGEAGEYRMVHHSRFLEHMGLLGCALGVCEGKAFQVQAYKDILGETVDIASLTREQLDELARRIPGTLKRNAELEELHRDDIETIERLKETVRKDTEAVERLDEKITQLTKQLIEKEKALEEKTALEEKIKKAASELERLRAKIGEQEASITLQKQLMDQYKAEEARTSEELRQNQELLASQKSQIDEFSAKVKALEEELGKRSRLTKEELQRLEAKHQESIREKDKVIENYEKKLSGLRGQLTKAQNALTDATTNKERIEAAIEAEREKSKLRISEKEATIRRLEAEKTVLGQNITDLQNRVKMYETKTAELTKERNELSAKRKEDAELNLGIVNSLRTARDNAAKLLSELSDIKIKYKDDLEKAETKRKTDLEAAEADYKLKLEEIEKQRKSELEALRAAHFDETFNISLYYMHRLEMIKKAAAARACNDVADIIKEFKKKIEEIDEEHEKEIAQINLRYKARYDSLKERFDNLEKEYKDEREKHADEKNALKKEAELANDRYQLEKQRADELEGWNKVLNSMLKDAEAKASASYRNEQRIKAQLETLQKELNKTIAEVDTERIEGVDALVKAGTEYEKAIAAMEQRVVDAELRANQLNAEVDKLKAESLDHIQELCNLKRDKEELGNYAWELLFLLREAGETDIKELIDKDGKVDKSKEKELKEKIPEKLHYLVNELISHAKSEYEKSRLNLELNSAIESINKLEAKLKEYAELGKTPDELKEEFKKLTAQVDKLTEMLKEYEALGDINDLVSIKDRFAESEKEISRLKNRLEAINSAAKSAEEGNVEELKKVLPNLYAILEKSQKTLYESSAGLRQRTGALYSGNNAGFEYWVYDKFCDIYYKLGMVRGKVIAKKGIVIEDDISLKDIDHRINELKGLAVF